MPLNFRPSLTVPRFCHNSDTVRGGTPVRVSSCLVSGSRLLREDRAGSDRRRRGRLLSEKQCCYALARLEAQSGSGGGDQGYPAQECQASPWQCNRSRRESVVQISQHVARLQ